VVRSRGRSPWGTLRFIRPSWRNHLSRRRWNGFCLNAGAAANQNIQRQGRIRLLTDPLQTTVIQRWLSLWPHVDEAAIASQRVDSNIYEVIHSGLLHHKMLTRELLKMTNLLSETVDSQLDQPLCLSSVSQDSSNPSTQNLFQLPSPRSHCTILSGITQYSHCWPSLGFSCPSITFARLARSSVWFPVAIWCLSSAECIPHLKFCRSLRPEQQLLNQTGLEKHLREQLVY